MAGDQGSAQDQRKKQETGAVRALFWAAAFLVLYGTWLLFTANLDWEELVIGIPAAAIGATAFEATREQPVAQFWPKATWLLEGWRLPWYVLTGTFEIFKVLAQDVLGSKPAESLMRAAKFDAGGDDPRSAARRALAIAYTTMPPNSIVVSIDLEANELVFHQIIPEPPRQTTLNLGAG